MADIWPVFEGREPTRGEPWASVRMDEAVRLMNLSPEDFVSTPDRTPRFGPQDMDLWSLGYRYVIVEVHAVEAKQDWRPGFYRSPLPPREAFNRLLQQAISNDLGPENVLRVEVSGSYDSENEETLRLMVILTPNAVPRLPADASIAAFGNLFRRLGEMNIRGTPSIQYATEAELAEGDA